ncbi:APC family permease [Microlunatus ginsengisoli]|uniref:APC family permease n=1 Tax=Microlunatus ginsengisoli TaxID=363863 RepID=A0ABP6ZSP7_9ACTN
MTVAAPDAPPGATEHLKTDALGATSIAFLVIAAAAPLTVMAGVAPVAIMIGGIGAPVGYLAAGAVLALFAVGFMAMTKHTGGAGAFYSYITLGLGRRLGMGAGILAVVAYNALQIGVYGLLGQQVSDAVATLAGIQLPWWLFVFVAIAGVWAIGRRGIDVGARILGVLLIAETAILALLVVAVIVQGGANGLSGASFTPSAVFAPGMFGVLAFAFAAFMGFESTALYRPEAREPGRTIPRATYGAVIFMALFYCLVVWAVIQAYGNTAVVEAANNDPATLFFVAIQTYVGDWAKDVMYVLIMTSVFASQIAFHNAINRYTFTLARDGLLPARLAHTHPRYGSPSFAGAVQSALAVIIVGVVAVLGLDPYTDLLLKVNTPGVVGIITLQAITSAAVVAYFVRRRHTVRARVAVVCALLATVLLTLAVVLLVSHIGLLTNAAGITNVILVGIVPVTLLIGIVAAGVLKNRRPAVYAGIGGVHPEDGHVPPAEPTDEAVESSAETAPQPGAAR